MTSIVETICEQTAGVLFTNLCEGLSVIVCNTVGACYDPIVESCWTILGGGK